MNDMGFMDRESKKRQLRRNIVQPPQEERPSRYEEEDSEEVIRQVASGKAEKADPDDGHDSPVSCSDRFLFL